MSLDDSKASDTRMSTSERSLKSPFSTQSPATHENSNIVIFEVKEQLNKLSKMPDFPAYFKMSSRLSVDFQPKYPSPVHIDHL